MPSSRAARACGVCVEVTAAPRRVPCRVAPLSALVSVTVLTSRSHRQSIMVIPRCQMQIPVPTFRLEFGHSQLLTTHRATQVTRPNTRFVHCALWGA